MWRRILLLVSISGVYALNGKCRVLAIAGGTEMGAYQAGVIIGLINNLPAGEAEYDVVVGTGVGAINGLIVSYYSQGSENDAASTLKSFWTGFTYQSFYVDWIGGIATGLLLKSGLYDSGPMGRTVAYYSPLLYYGRWFSVGATDLLTGAYVPFNTSSQSLSTMITGVLASAADPGVFPIVEYKNFKLISGYLKYSIDIITAVNRCNELGYADSNIIVHAVLGFAEKIQKVQAADYTTIQNTFRYFEIVAYDTFSQTLEDAQHDYPEINIQYKIFPSKNLTKTIQPYDFNKTELAAQLNLGQSDALNAIKSALAFK
jgi:hypothetical protein